MDYLIITVVLFALMLVYFRIADKYNIIDKPNHRSAHTEITLRGGGIIYPIAFLLFLASIFIFKDENLIIPTNRYLIFGTGLLSICTISFVDDILDLSSTIRLVFHFIAVSLLLWFLNAFQVLPIWAIPLLYILIIGILNAYNFMDGINGMSGLYSLVTLATLLFINKEKVFTDNDFIIYPILASVVFLFFNFRKKAKCFMGDVGSMGIAFWVMALIGLLIFKTQDFRWLLLLTVYGAETVLTIIERIRLKENIFDAHRRHLYQLFANDRKTDHRLVSSGYAFIQLLINVLLIFTENLNDLFIIPAVVLGAVTIYLFIKTSVKKSLFIS